MHLKLDGTLLDETANSNDLVEPGASYVAGRYGQAITLAANENATVTHAATISGTVFTIAFWVRTNTVPTAGWNSIAEKGGQFKIFADTDDAPGAFVYRTVGSGGASINDGTIATTINNWVHMAFAANGTVWNSYVNGALDKGPMAADATKLQEEAVQMRFSVGSETAMQFDDIRYYDRALAINEIRQLAQNPYNAINQGIKASISPSMAYSPATTSL
jgi:hypothetical protein